MPKYSYNIRVIKQNKVKNKLLATLQQNKLTKTNKEMIKLVVVNFV